jgi:hypothetical protein
MMITDHMAAYGDAAADLAAAKTAIIATGQKLAEAGNAYAASPTQTGWQQLQDAQAAYSAAQAAYQVALAEATPTTVAPSTLRSLVNSVFNSRAPIVTGAPNPQQVQAVEQAAVASQPSSIAAASTGPLGVDWTYWIAGGAAFVALAFVLRKPRTT